MRDDFKTISIKSKSEGYTYRLCACFGSSLFERRQGGAVLAGVGTAEVRAALSPR